MGKFCLVMDSVNIDLIRTCHLSYVRQGMMEGLIQDEVANEIGGDPGQNLMLFQLPGFMMRVESSSGFL